MEQNPSIREKIFKKVRFYFFSVLARAMYRYMFGGKYDPAHIALMMTFEHDPFLNNASRLSADAHLLITEKRYASALALAVLSFEEIGKFLLNFWDTDGPWNAEDLPFHYDKSKPHIMKQAAVAALFTTVEIRKRYKESKVNFQNFSDDELRKLAEAVQSGHEAGKPFAILVLNKVYEHVKWSGLYYDPDKAAKGIEPSKVTEENAKEMMALTFKAIDAFKDPKNITIARSSFVYMLDDLSKQSDS